MKIGIPAESLHKENRIAVTPQSSEKLIALGFDVLLEKGAGGNASFLDSDYQNVGATIGAATDVWQADVVMKVNAPTMDEVKLLSDGATLISFIQPAQNSALVNALAKKNITVIAMDMVPRMTRSQSMDALSSMANIAGYRAVVEASHQFGRLFTGQITAAGNMPPAKVLVIGAGVAGLAAIGTAGSLGAIVRAFDTRPEVKEQIESMGAEFLMLDFEEDVSSADGYAKEMSQEFIDAEMALFKAQAQDVDIIITTAMIPGKPAPKLITAEMVKLMKPGSVIVDMAAPAGGNCELTKPGSLTTKHQVKIIGYTDLVSRLANQSSQLLSNNMFNFIKLCCPKGDGILHLDQDDEVVRHMTVVDKGSVTFPPPPIKVSASVKKTSTTPAKSETGIENSVKETTDKRQTLKIKFGVWSLLTLLFLFIANTAPAEFVSQFTVFSLSCIIGYHVIWNVSHSLHTPLMSVTNAISGIIIVGALLQIGSDSSLVVALSFFAILIATINIVGGFLVTDRMLKMFRK